MSSWPELWAARQGVLEMSIVQNIETLPQHRGGNYEVARFNALCHGVLSRHTVLPWEDGEEYRSLLEALVAEHNPQGPTEEHLVEELVGIIWRSDVCARGKEPPITAL
jgi:hypothetical protein